MPFGCTVPAVHQLSNTSPQYLGIVPSGSPERQATFAAADLVITCGLNISDVTTGGFRLDLSGKTVAKLTPTYAQFSTEGRSDPAVYYGAGLSDVLAGALSRVAEQLSSRDRWWPAPKPTPVEPDQDGGAQENESLTEAYFFNRLENFVRPDDVLIAETGTSSQNTVGLSLPAPIRYINQSSWGSIGYALPALLGSLAASPDRRHILCTGDGSFQVTAQELSTIIRGGFSPVIFLLNNRGYTIERAILGKHSTYNDVANWAYRDIARAFGVEESDYLSRLCETRSELESAMADLAHSQQLAFVEVNLEVLDMPPVTSAVGEFTRVYDYGEYGPPNK